MLRSPAEADSKSCVPAQALVNAPVFVLCIRSGRKNLRHELGRSKRGLGPFRFDISGISVGWGGRIRTSVSRNQNPLPYHLATPQRPWQVNRNATLPATGRPANPRHAGVKIEAYHRREDRIHGYGPVGTRERCAQPRVAAPSRPERVRPRDGGRLPFPGYFPITGNFPGFWQSEIPGFGRRRCAASAVLSN